MDSESLSVVFLRCNSEDADALQGGRRLTKVRVLGQVAIAHPDEWVADGSRFDLVVTRKPDKVVNGEIPMKFVDAVLHRVIGVDHEAARRQGMNG